MIVLPMHFSLIVLVLFTGTQVFFLQAKAFFKRIGKFILQNLFLSKSLVFGLFTIND